MLLLAWKSVLLISQEIVGLKNFSEGIDEYLYAAVLLSISMESPEWGHSKGVLANMHQLEFGLLPPEPSNRLKTVLHTQYTRGLIYLQSLLGFWSRLIVLVRKTFCEKNNLVKIMVSLKIFCVYKNVGSIYILHTKLWWFFLQWV